MRNASRALALVALAGALASPARADSSVPGRGRTPPPPATIESGDACRSDGECVVTAFAGCCVASPCCPAAPHPAARRALEKRQALCAIVDCAAPRCNPAECEPAPPVSEYVAACRAGRCVADHRASKRRPPGPPPECDGDEECTLSYEQPPAGARCHSSPCGCCPVVPTAHTLRLRVVPKAETPPPPPPSPRPPDAPPLFPPGVTCSPCQSGPPATAICREGRCVVGPPECSADDECSLYYENPPPGDSCHGSTCGCCPTVPRVAPLVRRTTPSPPPTPATPPAPATPPTLDRAPPAPPPQCEICPPGPPARAACRRGRCETELLPRR